MSVKTKYIELAARALTVLLCAVNIGTWLYLVANFAAGGADFRQLYTAGAMLQRGNASHLYDPASQLHWQSVLVGTAKIPLPFNHLAYEALLFAPFSMLRFRFAYLTFLAFNLALLVGSFYLLRPWTANLRSVFRSLPAMMFVSFLPIGIALLQGQDSVLLSALLVASLALIHSGRPLSAGLIVGLGLFKFQIVLPIALLFLIWRHWRFCVGLAVSALTTGLTSLWIVGAVQAKAYAASLLSMSASSRDSLAAYLIKPEQMANLRGFSSGLFGAHPQVVTLVLSVLVISVVGMVGRKVNPSEALALAITTSAVVSYHFLIHDMSILLIPLVVVTNRFIYRGVVMVAATLLFTAPIVMYFAPEHFYLVALPLCLFLAVQAREEGRQICGKNFIPRSGITGNYIVDSLGGRKWKRLKSESGKSFKKQDFCGG